MSESGRTNPLQLFQSFLLDSFQWPILSRAYFNMKGNVQTKAGSLSTGKYTYKKLHLQENVWANDIILITKDFQAIE